MVVVVASFHSESLGLIPQWREMFSPLWTAVVIILECETSILPPGFHG